MKYSTLCRHLGVTHTLPAIEQPQQMQFIVKMVFYFCCIFCCCCCCFTMPYIGFNIYYQRVKLCHIVVLIGPVIQSNMNPFIFSNIKKGLNRGCDCCKRFMIAIQRKYLIIVHMMPFCVRRVCVCHVRFC